MAWHVELATLLHSPAFYGVGVPRGDGAPVVAVPGLLADDGVLAVLRDWLARLGYVPHPSGIGVNVDCSERGLQKLEHRVERIVAEGGRKVAIVGHSRGGQFGKALATRRPDLVSCLVSLGSPLAAPLDVSIPTRAVVAALRRNLHASDAALERSGCMTTACRCTFAQAYEGTWPSEVACTTVYTKRDGVVWWEACLVPYAHPVEVDATHVGMAWNAAVYREIAIALAWGSRSRVPGAAAA